MKILVTGAQGMLGRDLLVVLERGNEVIGLSRRELDVTDRDETIRAVRDAKPDIVINCAAYTKVDDAESERDRAFLVNGVGTQNLALACSDAGIPLCHISTDYVFDGSAKRPYTPFDSTNPINTYGESKLAGEKYIQWITDKFYIIRTSWLYGRHGNNFVKTIIRLAQEREELNVVDDQRGSPTWTITLSQGIAGLIETGAYGIYHITDDSEGGISWFTLAQEIINIKGFKTLLKPIGTEDYPRPAARPLYSVLDTSLNRHIFRYEPQPWQRTLARCMDRL